MIEFDATKQIGFVGLRRTGECWYRCRYPLLLVAWLKEQGYTEEPIGMGEIARLANCQAEVRVRKTGSVHIVGEDASEVHTVLGTLVKV